MTGYTHILTGIVISNLIFKDPVSVAVSAVASVLPDMDINHSMVNRPFHYKTITAFTGTVAMGYMASIGKLNIMSALILSSAIIYCVFTPHRTFSHSILSVIIFTTGLALSGYHDFITPFIIGYVSHLGLDILNPSGISLFYPYKGKFSLNLIRTGSIYDYIISVVLFIMLI